MSYSFTVEIEVEVPGWATVITVDKNGEAWFYENEPFRSTGGAWNIWVNPGGRNGLAYKGPAPEDWTKEIYDIWRKD